MATASTTTDVPSTTASSSIVFPVLTYTVPTTTGHVAITAALHSAFILASVDIYVANASGSAIPRLATPTPISMLPHEAPARSAV